MSDSFGVDTVDPDVTVVAMLTGDPRVQELVFNRIWSPRVPPGYDPTKVGSAISLHIRGGRNGLYDPIVEPSFQVVSWAVSTKAARAVMSAVTGVLHNVTDQMVDTVDGQARVMTGVQEVYPQDVIDSDTGWFTCVSFFRLKMILQLNA